SGMQHATADDGAQGGSQFLLIIDPIAGRQRQLRTVLTSLGFRASHIQNTTEVAEARRLLRRRHYLCCFAAQSAEALDLVKYLRADMFLRKQPIVIFREACTRESVLEAAAAGATSFLAYPFCATDVEGIIRKA